MARPKKQGADWFRHDKDMSSHRKIVAVEKRFGIVGYGIYCKLLEVMTGANDQNRIYLTPIEIELRAGEFGVETETFQEILEYMVRLQLLRKEDESEEGFYLYSEGLRERLEPVYEKRQNARSGVSATETRVPATETRVPATESTQSKSKSKSRVREENKNNSLSWEKMKIEDVELLVQKSISAIEDEIEQALPVINTRSEAAKILDAVKLNNGKTSKGAEIYDFAAYVGNWIRRGVSSGWYEKKPTRNFKGKTKPKEKTMNELYEEVMGLDIDYENPFLKK